MPAVQTRLKPGMSRKAAMPAVYHHFVKLLQTSKNPKMSKMRNRLMEKHKEKYEAAAAAMNELAARLNFATRKHGHHEAAMNEVAATYGLDKPLLKKLFYDVGAPVQSLIKFEMEKSKSSHAMKLLTSLREQKGAGKKWEEVQPGLLQKASKMRTKKPEHQRSIIQSIESAKSFEQAESSLLNQHLKMTGKGVLQVASLSRIEAAYTIPWENKEWVRKAQAAGKKHPGITIHGSRKGLFVLGEHNLLARGGLTLTDRKLNTGKRRVREASVGQITEQYWYRHPSGKITAELHTTMPATAASRLVDWVIKSPEIYAALVVDNTGKAHKRIFNNETDN